MHWQTAVTNPTEIDATVANLLDTLERARPIRDIQAGLPAVGRWLMESSEDGAIADDTVVWLHRMLLPNAA
jgi:hypothetical protein